jgi:hypothetical protein
MKKLLVTLLVAVLCVPAMADVEVTAVGDGLNLEIYVNTTAGEEIRGLSVELNADSGMTVDVVEVEAPFNAFPDFYYSNSGYLDEMAGDETLLPGSTDDGLTLDAHPLALIQDRGAAALGSEDVSLSMGILDNSGAKAGLDTEGTAVLVATLTYGAAGDVCLTADTYRGSVVGDDVATVTVQAECVTLASDECIPASHADYAEWDAVGKPESWCAPRQCYGDANGAENQYGQLPPPLNTPLYAWVTSEDLTILLEGYKQAYTVGDAWIAADFNRQQDQYGQLPPPLNTPLYARVTAEDLTILLTWYKQSGVPTDCND